MTEAPGTFDSSALIRAWADSLTHVIGQIAGSPPPALVFDTAPPDLTPPGEGDLWIICTFSGGLRGELSIRLAPPSILRLAQALTREPAEGGLTAVHADAAVELLRQAAGFAATALKPACGEVQLHLEPSPAAPSWAACSTHWIRVGEDSAPSLLEVHLSAALAAAMRPDQGAPQGPPAEADSAPVAPATPESQPKLDLLMDVELALTLRFGSRSLLLREVLDLHPGAVVELDREVQDPVDVLLDGRLVARGEVVVIDGNYGLRVTEVASGSPVNG